MSKFVRKTLGLAVLDSACSRTVAGKLWFDIFFGTLNDQDKSKQKLLSLTGHFVLVMEWK